MLAEGEFLFHAQLWTHYHVLCASNLRWRQASKSVADPYRPYTLHNALPQSCMHWQCAGAHVSHYCTSGYPYYNVLHVPLLLLSTSVPILSLPVPSMTSILEMQRNVSVSDFQTNKSPSMCIAVMLSYA